MPSLGTKEAIKKIPLDVTLRLVHLWKESWLLHFVLLITHLDNFIFLQTRVILIVSWDQITKFALGLHHTKRCRCYSASTRQSYVLYFRFCATWVFQWKTRQVLSPITKTIVYQSRKNISASIPSFYT